MPALWLQTPQAGRQYRQLNSAFLQQPFMVIEVD